MFKHIITENVSVCIVYRLEQIKVYKHRTVFLFLVLRKLIFKIFYKITAVSYIGQRIGIYSKRKLLAHFAELFCLTFKLYYHYCDRNHYAYKRYYKRKQRVKLHIVISHIQLRKFASDNKCGYICNEHRRPHYNSVQRLHKSNNSDFRNKHIHCRACTV